LCVDRVADRELIALVCERSVGEDLVHFRPTVRERHRREHAVEPEDFEGVVADDARRRREEVVVREVSLEVGRGGKALDDTVGAGDLDGGVATWRVAGTGDVDGGARRVVRRVGGDRLETGLETRYPRHG
jgi:hypothetical protein